MFVVNKQEMVLAEQTHSLCTPRYPFSQRVTCGNEMTRNHPKHEFLTKSSGLGMFIAKKQEMVPGIQTHALYAPRYFFSLWVTCGNKMAQNHAKHEFWTKSSGLGMFVEKKTRNGSGGTNSFLVYIPIPVFALGHVQQRNDAKLPQT